MDRFISVTAAVDAASLSSSKFSISGELVLPFAERQKTRQRSALLSGEAIEIVLARGSIMRGGDCLSTADGRHILVTAAVERASTVRSQLPEQLARAAYHLGNRHVWVQVGPGWLRYLADHVLDKMMIGLGMAPEPGLEAFEPEAGAYGAQHPHSQPHTVDQHHGHGHDHPH